MDPLSLVILGLIGATAGLAGSAINSASQQKSNETNLELNKEANEANIQIAKDTMAYNSAEAQKNRDFQLMMSNTAHQREVADLKAAGLNPWLSVQGAGAPMASGSTAQSSRANVNPGSVDSIRAGDGLASLASTAQSLAFMMALGARADASNKTYLEVADKRLQASQNYRLAQFYRYLG